MSLKQNMTAKYKYSDLWSKCEKNKTELKVQTGKEENTLDFGLAIYIQDFPFQWPAEVK